MATEPGFRPLYLVNELAQAAGEEITYAYDDIAFISHSEVLVQFADDADNTLLLFVHQDMDDAAFTEKKEKYLSIAQQQGTTLRYKGRFSMTPKEGSDEIDLQFFPED